MAINRLFSKKRQGHSQKMTPVCPSQTSHEGVEVSLCDEGMCFSSHVQHAIGAVLLVDFEPETSDNDSSLRSEAMVVDCQPSLCGRAYDITVLFTGN